MTDPDRSLADRARRGDRRALEALYDRYRTRLYGHLRRMLRRPATADEVFQDTWVKVIEGIGGWRPDAGTFRSWLFRVATNAAYDRMRRDAVRAADSLDAPTGEDETAPIDRLPSREPDPESGGAAALLRDDLQSALASLAPGQRAAVLMRHRLGFDYREIAAALSVPVGTAKTMVHRGGRHLRRRLARWIDDDA